MKSDRLGKLKSLYSQRRKLFQTPFLYQWHSARRHSNASNCVSSSISGTRSAIHAAHNMTIVGQLRKASTRTSLLTSWSLLANYRPMRTWEGWATEKDPYLVDQTVQTVLQHWHTLPSYDGGCSQSIQRWSQGHHTSRECGWMQILYQLVPVSKYLTENRTYQYTQRTPEDRDVAAHFSKQALWMLLPQAAWHQTSASSGSNSMKQIGQSPSIGFRLPSFASAWGDWARLKGDPW